MYGLALIHVQLAQIQYFTTKYSTILSERYAFLNLLISMDLEGRNSV